MHRSKQCLASRDETCPIHGLVTSMLRDLRAKYPLSQRMLKPVYSSLRTIFKGCLYGTELNQAIELVTQYESALLHWSGSGCEISLCGLNFSPDAMPGLVRDLRQCYRLFWKSTGISPHRSVKSASLARLSTSKPHQLTSDDLTAMRNHCARLLGKCPDSIIDLPGRHGPGAVAESYTGIDKWKLEDFFFQMSAIGGFKLLFFNENHVLRSKKQLIFHSHPITRYVEVPKDIRKNRVISCEPCSMQYLQQSVLPLLMERLHTNSRGVIEFRSQERHTQHLHRGLYNCATIDLSDASDMVSRRLMWNILPHDWRVLLFALRSRFISDGLTTVPIRSFAPMGSALCFLIEALLHYLVVDRFSEKRNAYLSIYGDDIIISRHNFKYVMSGLKKSGLIPNDSKSCSAGFFRETCGTDLLLLGGDGCTSFDVTVSYFRGNLMRLGVNDIPGCQVVARALHNTGMYSTRDAWMTILYDRLLHRVPHKFITYREGSQYHWPPTTVHTYRSASTRWNRRFQVEEVLTPMVSIKTLQVAPVDYEGMLATLRTDGMRAEVSYSPSRANARLKCRWLATSCLDMRQHQ
jgi:hypothetical protein